MQAIPKIIEYTPRKLESKNKCKLRNSLSYQETTEIIAKCHNLAKEISFYLDKKSRKHGEQDMTRSISSTKHHHKAGQDILRSENEY